MNDFNRNYMEYLLANIHLSVLSNNNIGRISMRLLNTSSNWHGMFIVCMPVAVHGTVKCK